MQRGAIALALALLLAQGGCVASGGVRTLTLPRALDAADRVYLEVRLGALASGQEIELSTDRGRRLGVISPHAIRPGREAGTYTVPLPADAIRDGGVRIRLITTPAGGAARDANVDEVREVRLIVNK
ncbi:hypothetical protein [Lysobacter sp. Root690]|uniref:hypothetical protein n=1 Tax=Lysobacter sp. Root690 TaxID=1736588 RepID=UPI0006FA230A|nr:hypothetical protein [Lysobacter sp. Root690]KRB07157.1 hypothetical protein ASD86_14450 [Lysobacter sp. Root690]